MFRLIQTGPKGENCTAPFVVQFYDATELPTVGEFIAEVLSRREWGWIEVVDSEYPLKSLGRIDYKGNAIESGEITDEVKAMQIKSVNAGGGVSNMDYMVFVSKEDGSVHTEESCQ